MVQALIRLQKYAEAITDCEWALKVSTTALIYIYVFDLDIFVFLKPCDFKLLVLCVCGSVRVVCE